MESVTDLKDYWWEQPKGELHKTLFGIVRYLEQTQAYRREKNLRHLRLYGNLNVSGLTSNTYSAPLTGSATDKVTLNIIGSMCDTATNKIAKNKVKPKFLTEDGQWSLKEKAENLEQFVDGMFYETKYYQKEVEQFHDATIFGTGVQKIFRHGKQIKVERRFIDSLLVDDYEAMYGNPRSLYETLSVPREILVRLFPKFRSQIMSVKKSEGSDTRLNSMSNNVQVVEAWHLRSSKEAKDGRHVIAIENCDLSDREYKKDYFPFIFEHWKKAPLGFFGIGLAEELIGLQIEINKILRTIQVAFHLLGIPKVYLEMGSKVVKAHLNNEVGGLVYYSGTMPTVVNPSTINPEMFAHLDRLVARAYEIAGVSMLSAASKKPEGLDSGKALREFNDIESERFILAGQMREEASMEAAKQMIELAKEIDEEEEGGFASTAVGSDFIRKIKWKEINMEDDEYRMKCFPTSFFSDTPSGRLEDIKDLAEIGGIDKRNLMRQLDFPDLKRFTSLATAAIDDIEKMIGQMTKGQYNAPEPFQDLQMGIQMVQSAYLKYKRDGLPEAKLELFRRWMEEASAQMAKANAPAPVAPGEIPQGMPQGQPQAVPQAPPQSALLPTTPGVA